MVVLSYIYFSTAVGCVVIGILLLTKRYRNRQSTSLAGLAFALAFWALGYTGISSDLASRETVMLWYRFSAIGWIGFIPMVFWFVFTLTYPERPVPRWAVALFVLWAGTLLLQQWRGTIFVTSFNRLSVGWGREGYLDSRWAWLYLLVFFAVAVWSIFALIQAIRRTRLAAKRLPLMVILVGLLLNYLAGTADVLLLPVAGASSPNTVIIAVFLVVFVVSLMMIRRRFLLTDYQLIMEEIMDTLSDAVVITDADGLVIRMNRTARSFFDRSEEAARFNLREIVENEELLHALEGAGASDSDMGRLSIAYPGDCDELIGQATLYPVADRQLGLLSFILVITFNHQEARFLKNQGFTRQEITVALLLLEGYTNAEIAEQLFVSYGTVKNHVSRIFSRVGVNNRSTFIRYVRSGVRCDDAADISPE